MFAVILIARLFYLQIIRGESYRSNYNLKIEKTEPVDAVRGNIYDRNGKLLTYNDLAYTVTLTDNGNYKDSSDKAEKFKRKTVMRSTWTSVSSVTVTVSFPSVIAEAR